MGHNYNYINIVGAYDILQSAGRGEIQSLPLVESVNFFSSKIACRVKGFEISKLLRASQRYEFALNSFTPFLFLIFVFALILLILLAAR